MKSLHKIFLLFNAQIYKMVKLIENASGVTTNVYKGLLIKICVDYTQNLRKFEEDITFKTLYLPKKSQIHRSFCILFSI